MVQKKWKNTCGTDICLITNTTISDPRSELGTDLCQAIKYVYRNAETVLDDATQENLQQIDKDLENIQ